MSQACAAGLVIPAAHQSASAVESSAYWFEQTARNAWLQSYDPTLISRRALSELSFEEHDDETQIWKIENSLRWGFPIQENLAFGLQMMIPVKWIDSPVSDDSGLGDLELRAGIVGRISPTLRYGLGLNSEFDTASDSSLGNSALTLRPIAAIRWDVAKHVNIGLNFEYTFTPLDEGTDDISAFELKFPLVVKLNDDWSAAATYKPKWNFLTEDDRHRLELGATRVWGADHQFAMSFSTEVPLSSDSLEFKVIAGFSWYFR